MGTPPPMGFDEPPFGQPLPGGVPLPAPQEPGLWPVILSDLLLIGFYYVNYYVLVSRFYFAKRYMLYALIVAAFIGLLIFMPTFWNLVRGRPNHVSLLGVGDGLFMFISIPLVSLAMRISDERERAEQARLNAELRYLKAQINPHFLFNTLNSIYTLALTKSDRTADVVFNLSSLMRYVLSEAHQPYVLLEKELAYIKGYVELQRVRLARTVAIELISVGEPGTAKIAPLLLITFIENAFKHGVSTEEESAISIRMTIQDTHFELSVCNRLVQTSLDPHEQSGIGIENTRQRLILAYPNKHRLTLQNDGQLYQVSLLLDLS